MVIGAWHTAFRGYSGAAIERVAVFACRRNAITTCGYYPGSATQQSHADFAIRDCMVTGVTGRPYKLGSQ